MTLANFLLLNFLCAALVFPAPATEKFDLNVARVRIPRDQPGNLHIDARSVTFRSSDGKTRIEIPTMDLRRVSLADAHALRFEVYAGRKRYVFRAPPDAPIEEIARFLSAHVHRPVVGHYRESSQFQVAAYHKRVFGGTNGTLEIGRDSIQFVSDKPADSRTWLYSDIETIGRPDSFRFRVTTIEETYILELKEKLPDAAYQFAWNKIYNSERSAG